MDEAPWCERCGDEPVVHLSDGLWLGARCDQALEDQRALELLEDELAA